MHRTELAVVATCYSTNTVLHYCNTVFEQFSATIYTLLSQITAQSGDPKLSICAMRFVEAGWYIPCMDTKVKANVTGYHPEIPGKNGRTNKELTLTLGIISNIGKNH